MAEIGHIHIFFCFTSKLTEYNKSLHLISDDLLQNCCHLKSKNPKVQISPSESESSPSELESSPSELESS